MFQLSIPTHSISNLSDPKLTNSSQLISGKFSGRYFMIFQCQLITINDNRRHYFVIQDQLMNCILLYIIFPALSSNNHQAIFNFLGKNLILTQRN